MYEGVNFQSKTCTSWHFFLMLLTKKISETLIHSSAFSRQFVKVIGAAPINQQQQTTSALCSLREGSFVMKGNLQAHATASIIYD